MISLWHHLCELFNVSTILKQKKSPLHHLMCVSESLNREARQRIMKTDAANKSAKET